MSDPDFPDDPVVETGLTSTVTEEEQVDAMRLLVGMPEDIDPLFLTQLARDIAQNFHSRADVLKKHNLSQAQYDFLNTYNKFFQAILIDQIKAWQGVAGTEERVKLQTLLALEELLPTIAGRMGRPTEELKDVIEGAKLFAKISGVDASEKRSGSVGERFQIVIDLGADTVTIGNNQPVIDVTPEKK